MEKDLNHEETFTATVSPQTLSESLGGTHGSLMGTPDDPIKYKALTLFQGLPWQWGINSFH